MDDNIQHKLVTYSDGQQILIKQTPSIQVSVQIDDETVIDETDITHEKYAELKIIASSDTIMPTGNDTNMTDSIPSVTDETQAIG